MDTKGWGPWRYDWFSICSAHQKTDWTCPRCQCGYWAHHWKWLAGHLVYKIAPEFWRWWFNRK